MSTKTEIKNILLNNFGYVYCDTCAHKGNENICDCCHRKSMDWSLSPDVADEVAEEILKIVGNNFE